MLYDYATGQISDTDRIRLMDHLSRCRSCSDHLQRLETTFRLLSIRRGEKPSERLTPEYWSGFVRSVDLRLRQEKQPSVFARAGEVIEEAILGRRRTLVITGGALALVVALSFFVRLPAPEQPPSVAGGAPAHGARIPGPSAEVHQYLRRSRTLLVGLEHMEVPAKKSLDLGSERKLSRELLRQARELQGRPMDLHTARLVDDVERVLIEIANADDSTPQHMEVIRGGIRQENLLFKLRMADAAYLQTASLKRERP
jgi:hypothetical protein